jgi:hypothetical protein
MTKSASKNKSKPIASGEGERRAQRGYVPQYDLAARVIYGAITAGKLEWIGVADRGAGAFDDCVLGLTDRIEVYQVKTSQTPEAFSIRTVLLGADDLMGRMLEARRQLLISNPTTPISTVFACDDFPRTTDDIGLKTGISSAAFLRAHQTHRTKWSLADWLASPFEPLVKDLQAASKLSADAFADVFANMRFETAGQGRSLGLDILSGADERRVKSLAAELPRMAADPINRDRWTLQQLLDRLRWRDFFAQRHKHLFPIDAFYETNQLTQDRLLSVLTAVDQGYVSLVGPPGTGKSTLLQAGLLPTPKAIVVRYLAYVPGEGQGLGRSEAFDFLHDLIAGLKSEGRGEHIATGSDLPELRQQVATLLGEASAVFATTGVRTIIVVDGLDHVPREERPQHSFLRELPLPSAIPPGVVFILGTQRLSLPDIPPSVAEQAKGAARCVTVAPLTPEAVSRLANLAGVPTDVDRAEIFKRTEGHPLSTRYVIQALNGADDATAREDWLRDGPSFNGDVEVFYDRAWRDLQADPNAEKAMAYIALAEGSIHPNMLDRLVGRSSTDAVWRAASYLLVVDHRRAWSIFHNSFRLYLRQKAGIRFDEPDPALLSQRYRELAEAAQSADVDEPQKWLALRYTARAGDHAMVTALAKPQLFRTQIAQGRGTVDIRDDIRLAVASAKATRDSASLLDLILADHELGRRSEALGDAVFDAHVALGDLDRALTYLDTGSGVTLSGERGFFLVDALLDKQRAVDAQRLFFSLEPLDLLLGSKLLRPRDDEAVLRAWARRALIFRDINQVLACIDRIQRPEAWEWPDYDLEQLRNWLKVQVAAGQLERTPNAEIDSLLVDLKIKVQHKTFLTFEGALAAARDDQRDLARLLLESCAGSVGALPDWARRRAAWICADNGDFALAEIFLTGLDAPSLDEAANDYSEEALRGEVEEVLDHATLRARLGLPRTPGAAPEASLFALYQTRLETIGRLKGELIAGAPPHRPVLGEFRASLDFLQHARGEDRTRHYRRQINGSMDLAIEAMVSTVASDPKLLTAVVSMIDERLANAPGMLDRQSVRRAYAEACFRLDKDVSALERRLAYQGPVEATPNEQAEEVALMALTHEALGLTQKAREIIGSVDAVTFGYARAAKKDPQYLVWRAIFERANAEDPAGRPDRLGTFGRIISGLGSTEGDGAARRVTEWLLVAATQTSAAWAAAAIDRLIEADLVSWPDIVDGVVKGSVADTPALASAATMIFGRLSLPFSTSSDDNVFPQLIEAASAAEVETMTHWAINCLELDAHIERRVGFLEAVIKTARKRGVPIDDTVVLRWKGELPPERSGNSPEDPFFRIRSLRQAIKILERPGRGASHWGARGALERYADESSYRLCTRVFDLAVSLHRDAAALEFMVDLATAAGEKADADRYVEMLRLSTEERGSWAGSWFGDAKQRYHRVLIARDGEAARLAAFDAFADDVGAGREYTDYIPLDLAEILELLSPRLSWAATWDHLTEQLSQFREYRLAEDLAPAAGVDGSAAEALADLVVRAIKTDSIPLTQAAWVTANELCTIDSCKPVAIAVLRRLLSAGGYLTLLGAQIAWQQRAVPVVRDTVVPHLDALATSFDLAVRERALALGRAWSQGARRPRTPLPAFYQVALPDDPQAERFEPPSGLSATSPGLYTNDLYNRTWMLKQVLSNIADGSDYSIGQLRRRADQRMEQAGGEKAFGPEAMDEQRRVLRTLRLHGGYRKLLSVAALQAAREVAGELDGADALAPRKKRIILLHGGGLQAGVPIRAPEARSVGVPAPDVPTRYQRSDLEEWIAAKSDDEIAPRLSGHIVLAAAARHARRDFAQWQTSEQYFGPDVGPAAPILRNHLERLPGLAVCDGLLPFYDAIAPGLVVKVQSTVDGFIEPETLMFCPLAAHDLGWRPAPDNLFTFLDARGAVMAKSIRWRDGGILRRDSDHVILRNGWIVVVRADQHSKISELDPLVRTTQAWRRKAPDHG